VIVPTLNILLNDFEAHVRHEENVDLPMLEDVLFETRVWH
jgi:iron-sulfur cluster repair protein YtfE (RIC family)